MLTRKHPESASRSATVRLARAVALRAPTLNLARAGLATGIGAAAHRLPFAMRRIRSRCATSGATASAATSSPRCPSRRTRRCRRNARVPLWAARPGRERARRVRAPRHQRSRPGPAARWRCGDGQRASSPHGGRAGGREADRSKATRREARARRTHGRYRLPLAQTRGRGGQAGRRRPYVRGGVVHPPGRGAGTQTAKRTADLLALAPKELGALASDACAPP